MQCEVCTTEMYYFDKEEAMCTKCPDGATPLIISIVGLFVVICALSLLRFLCKENNQYPFLVFFSF